MGTAKIKSLLSDIILDINLARLSKRYFGKSSSWLYHKFDGTDGKIATTFTDKEQQLLKDSLYDLADRIRTAADKINTPE